MKIVFVWWRYYSHKDVTRMISRISTYDITRMNTLLLWRMHKKYGLCNNLLLSLLLWICVSKQWFSLNIIKCVSNVFKNHLCPIYWTHAYIWLILLLLTRAYIYRSPLVLSNRTGRKKTWTYQSYLKYAHTFGRHRIHLTKHSTHPYQA